VEHLQSLGKPDRLVSRLERCLRACRGVDGDGEGGLAFRGRCLAFVGASVACVLMGSGRHYHGSSGSASSSGGGSGVGSVGSGGGSGVGSGGIVNKRNEVTSGEFERAWREEGVWSVPEVY
jgi:hypothetical protein